MAATKTAPAPTKPKGFRVPYQPHPGGQAEFHSDLHRFRVLDCGRRWGKSLAGIIEARFMLNDVYRQLHRQGRIWIVAPTFPLVREDWMKAEEVLAQSITAKRLTDMVMEFAPEGTIEFKSAERDDEGLRGAGLDAAVLDEASRISEKSWTMGIRPALSDKQGRAVFISTPKGRNWFYECYLKGQDPSQSEWKSWKLPTHARPNFPAQEWKMILASTPEMILKQEYLAEFLEDEGAVFHGISRCLRGQLQEPREGCRYVMGADLARTEDFTVLAVVDRCHKHLVQLIRSKDLDWSIQKKLILHLAERYNQAEILVDSSGLGDPIEEDLRKAGTCYVRGFKFHSMSKQNLVEELMVAIEQGLIGLPDVPETAFLLSELRNFTYEQLPSGKVRYSAPSGQHDDGVIALGLALYAMRQELTQPIPDEEPPRSNRITFEDYAQMNESIAAYQRAFPDQDMVETFGRADGRLLAEFVRGG